MHAEVEILFKDYSLKNVVVAPYLSDFLYVNMLSIISGGNSTGSITVPTKGIKFGTNRNLGFSYLNKLFFPPFSNSKNLRKARVALWKNAHVNVFFWSTLIGLSFLSSNARLRRLYKSVPGRQHTQVTNTVLSNLNMPIRFFLTSSMRVKSNDNISGTSRYSGLQFTGVELLDELSLKSEFYFKNFRVVEKFFPVMANVFTVGFSEKFFYPYYFILNLGGLGSTFNVLFRVVTAGVLYVNRRPIEYLAGRNDLLLKRYQRFFSVFKYSCGIFVFYMLFYVYFSKYGRFDFLNKFQKLGNICDICGSSISLEFYELFETRSIIFDDIIVLGDLSKDFYNFNYNFFNSFSGWRSLGQLYFKFNSSSLHVVYSRLSRTSQIESCLSFLARFRCIINQNYLNLRHLTLGSIFRRLMLLDVVDLRVVATYYLYNNVVRPNFLFLFFQKKIWFSVLKHPFNFFEVLYRVWGYWCYFIQREVTAPNLITIKVYVKIYLSFFFKNSDFLINFLKKIYCLSLPWAIYLKFLVKSFGIFKFLRLVGGLTFLVCGLLLAGLILLGFWLVKLSGIYLMWVLICYAAIGFSYRYLRMFNRLALTDKRFFYLLFFRTKFGITLTYYFSKMWVTGLLINLFQISWCALYRLGVTFAKGSFYNVYLWQQYYKLLVTSLEYGLVRVGADAVYSIFPKFYTLSFFYFSKPSFLLNVQFKLLGFFWVSASFGKINWLLRMLVKTLFSELGWWVLRSNSPLQRSSDFIRIFFSNRVLTNTSSYNYANYVTWFNLLPLFDNFFSILLELLFVRGVLTYSRYLYFYKKFGFKSANLKNLTKVGVLVGDILLDGHVVNVFSEQEPKRKFILMQYYNYYLKFQVWALVVVVSLIVFLLSCVASLVLFNFFLGLIGRVFYRFRFFYLLGK